MVRDSIDHHHRLIPNQRLNLRWVIRVADFHSYLIPFFPSQCKRREKDEEVQRGKCRTKKNVLILYWYFSINIHTVIIIIIIVTCEQYRLVLSFILPGCQTYSCDFKWVPMLWSFTASLDVLLKIEVQIVRKKMNTTTILDSFNPSDLNDTQRFIIFILWPQLTFYFPNSRLR